MLALPAEQGSRLCNFCRLRSTAWSAVAKAPAMATGRSVRFTSKESQSLWDGSGSQEDLMVKDQCITVDEEDNITGAASKHEVHQFNERQPKGVLHRAFSVFLFDTEDRLLLQQRSAGKITFPNVWTNTCCSHPLHGQQPSEVDETEDTALGKTEGMKRAASRKLQHELGIRSEQLPVESFQYLTRLHYCAADTSSSESSGWGEHEMDYILFARANVTLNPNSEEVQDTRYVTWDELRAMMAPENGLLWSPWFRIICDRFLESWWNNLDRTLHSADMQDLRRIHSILD